MQGDTDKVFFGQGTGGSRSATLAGSAFHGAVEKIIAKAKKLAAHLLEVDAGDVKFAEGIFSSPKTNRTLTMQEVARAAADPAKLPKDMEGGLAATSVYRADVENYPNGCHVCEVEIDRDTGAVEIARYTVVDDVGTVLNPMLLHGQIHGGVAQGVGQILMEDICRDASGQLSPARSWTTRCRAPAISATSRWRAIRCRPRPTRSASRAPARPAASARCRRSPMRWSMRCRNSASGTSKCRRRRSASGAP